MELQTGNIPGEVLIKLAAEAIGRASPSIPDPSNAAHYQVTELGIPEVDQVLRDIQVQSISRLFDPPPPAPDPDGRVFRVSPREDHAHYLVKFQPDVISSEEAAARLTGEETRKKIDLAAPNFWFRGGHAAEAPVQDYHPDQWGLEQIHCPEAWKRTHGERRVVVAVVDTGVDLQHPDLYPFLLKGRNLVDFTGQRRPMGQTLIGNHMGAQGDPQDELGHGTHVAGAICCARTHDEGVSGVTRNCWIMPVRVIATAWDHVLQQKDYCGNNANMIRGIRWAADNGAKIINISCGKPRRDDFEAEAIDYAQQHGALVVAAMGNEGEEEDNETMYPAGYPRVIAVGATDQHNNRATFSSYGSHMIVCAPGVQIRSTWLGGGYETLSGTSFAAPHVSGVAALLFSAAQGLTCDQASEIIRKSSIRLDDETGAHPNSNFGWGLVDAEAALRRA
ncbi:S8 family serine peptidase [Streptomyces chryseus]|uniref:S8 family serine peptidase n=1 Tax=Streptomyces chryseus TaxID=68186 RepID=UPI00142EF8DC|nr:S8 family serine peptidase [Streptomyces chryseus]GGX29551.1 hypothetical protein GCM10010353_51060 [Streptomyces chryseus]